MTDLIGPDVVHVVTAILQIVFINVVLSADNAIVIGIAASGLTPKARQQALWLGIVMATLLRIVFAVVATTLLHLFGLLLAGGVLLVWVSWKLWREIRVDNDADSEADAEVGQEGMAPSRPRKTMGRALWQIIVADVSMSLDNVLAVAGAALDHPGILVAGLAISVLLMGFAASLVARLLERFQWIAYIGLAVILYIAVKMIWHGAHEVISYAHEYGAI